MRRIHKIDFSPTAPQLAALDAAVEQLVEKDFLPYLRLRSLLRDTTPASRREFQRIFSSHYRLNNGGLTNDFKKRYFKLLFAHRPSGNADPYSDVLRTLYRYPRRQGDNALQCSFVSKLVAIHDDSRPIFDVHVRNFFGIGPPEMGSLEFRLTGFARSMQLLRLHYMAWGKCAKFRRAAGRLCKRFPDLESCHTVRIADFLVWTVGRRRIGIE